MQLSLPEDSVPVKEMFERFFATESTSARVRAAEPVGFDAELWKELLALEVPLMRTASSAGGGEMSLFDACLMMEQAGRRLAPVPLAESLVALRVLGEVGGDAAREWIGKVRDEGAVLTFALHSVANGKPQLVPGGAVANGIVTFDGTELAIEVPAAALDAPHTLGGAALGVFTPGQGTRVVLASNADAKRIWEAGVEEWKILTSAALIGLAREAVEMGAAYACEREAFGQKIGTYQGLAHPLANDIIDADGAAMQLMWVLRAIADNAPDAGGLIATLFWWATRTATNCVAHSIHTFAGYGLSIEYDIQLYHRRAKAWALAYGDPEAELERGGRRLFLGETTSLPDPGAVDVNFASPDEGNALAEELRTLLTGILDPAKHSLFEENFEAHDWDVHRALGKAGFLFPSWPEKWGGRGADDDAARACRTVAAELGYAGLAAGVTGMAGTLVQAAGAPELQDEVLLGFARGEFTSCLGFTEPSGGSDVFAAKTRAVRDGDEWVINGQKMFTSGAELASYVLLLTRTDPDVPKHKGLTLFLVPLNVPGVEIQPVHTFMDERTNATFYADVRIPDRYRLGEVNGGVRMMATALSMEQGGSHYHHQMRKMVAAVLEWARNEERDGKPMIEHAGTLSRLARVYTHSAISEGLAARVLATRLAGEPDLAYGPASKVFTTEAFIKDSADLLDLASPGSLIRSKDGLGVVEIGYRHSTATSVYGGTSEVLRSMVAERRLNLPRSRA
ncbi:acyl-CoA dehydrogenase family protein [Novosphingobium sp. MMS21-SN21R]|uniref:acyl-CoA dehydrogenase family protein n=1 Tax=Novosphingobium sp. MMS21-SN21R TaxID=2969298 RepID=UPI0028864CA0|nr:acyl-CoA dehydrogenase family protein [Novosphingobium sp. MMS21-SN21R]MDT0509916.1 acyl-CoA dehydrogenase family protein [Novosphingobium sp. MMS21-SN21R]